MSMRIPALALALFSTALAGSARARTPADYQMLNPSDYHVFVRPWADESKPECAALGAAADWSRVTAPAAIMGHNVFGPPASTWSQHAVLFLARVADAGPTAGIFTVTHVSRTPNEIDVDYTFQRNPPATSTMRWYFALVVAKPLPPIVRFREAGEVVCEVDGATARN
jgi:hypothetical protein